MKEEALITWNDKDGKTKAIAFSQLYKALSNQRVVKRSVGTNIYKNVYNNNISIRDEYSRQDYDQYRPGEAKPVHPRNIMAVCQDEYKNNGIIHNIIDLMGDFSAKGVEVHHPVKKLENFHKEWFEMVDGYNVSERIANIACRLANVIIKTEFGTISDPKRKDMERTKAAVKEIPVSYSFLNPMSLEVVGEDVMPLISSKRLRYALNIPPYISKTLINPKTDYDKALVELVPPDLLSKLKRGERQVILPEKEISALHYKKDDWEIWATPMIFSILDELDMLRKMKQADLAALDGAISQIRIWKLGSFEHKILPSEAAINKLAEALVNNVGGGIIDLIWGPDLEYLDATTGLHNFLGEAKYLPTLNRIFAGLGIPPLFSGSTSQGSFTNNFIAIKTLIERLNYVRMIITKFWNAQFKLLQTTFGFKAPARISFDRITLNDESSILTLMKDLADRNLLSMETLHEIIDISSKNEKTRLKREKRERASGKIPEKMGPFSTSEDKIKQIYAQSGAYTPNELGVTLGEKLPGEKTTQDRLPKPKLPAGDKKGQSGQGRPKSSTDKVKRKSKVVTPRKTFKGKSSFVNTLAWSLEAYKDISEFLQPIYLKSLGKKNLRQLTNDEFEEFEKRKFGVLCSVEPMKVIDEDLFHSVNSIGPFDNDLQYSVYDKMLSKFLSKNREITTENKRFLACYAYTMFNVERASYDEEVNNDEPEHNIVI